RHLRDIAHARLALAPAMSRAERSLRLAHFGETGRHELTARIGRIPQHGARDDAARDQIDLFPPMQRRLVAPRGTMRVLLELQLTGELASADDIQRLPGNAYRRAGVARPACH